MIVSKPKRYYLKTTIHYFDEGIEVDHIDLNDYWEKSKHDNEGNVLYYENSEGLIENKNYGNK